MLNKGELVRLSVIHLNNLALAQTLGFRSELSTKRNFWGLRVDHKHFSVLV